VRYEKELTEYEAKQDKRTRLEEKTGKKPPEAGPKDKDQVNLTDEQSRIMPRPVLILRVD
jgi:hypothetical protein